MGIENEIIDILERNESLTISEIHDKLGYAKSTVSKYVSILEIKGKLSIRNVGRAKLVSLRKHGS